MCTRSRRKIGHASHSCNVRAKTTKLRTANETWWVCHFLFSFLRFFSLLVLTSEKICSKLNKRQRSKEKKFKIQHFFSQSVISNARNLHLFHILLAAAEWKRGQGGRKKNTEAHLISTSSKCQILTNIPHKHSCVDLNLNISARVVYYLNKRRSILLFQFIFDRFRMFYINRSIALS